MTVKEAISLMAYDTRYFLKSVRTGKTIRVPSEDKTEKIDELMFLPVADEPFITELHITKTETGFPYAYPVICILVKD